MEELCEHSIEKTLSRLERKKRTKVLVEEYLNKNKEEITLLETFDAEKNIDFDFIKSINKELDNAYDISLTEEEREKLVDRLENLSVEAVKEYHLTKEEWLVSGITGIIGVLIDIFLVKIPSKGMLTEGVSNIVKKLLSPEKIRELEQNNWVPYDAPYSKGKLDMSDVGMDKFEGLNTRTHRLRTLGHDPILGFIFGVKDIINGTLTGIDKNGCFIVTKVMQEDKNVTIGILEAIIRQFGHLMSDVGTKMGLPIPLMGLFQFCQYGEIDMNGKKCNIADIVEIMYVQGYNLNHLIAMSVPTLMTELIIRIYYIYSKAKNGVTFKDYKEWIPIGKPKVDKMLLVSHTIGVGGNILKVVSTNNILGLNITQFMAFFYQGSKELIKIIRNDEEKARHKYVMDILEKENQEIERKIEEHLKNF